MAEEVTKVSISDEVVFFCAVDGTEDHLIRDDVPREIDMDDNDDEDSGSLDDDIDELEFFSDSD